MTSLKSSLYVIMVMAIVSPATVSAAFANPYIAGYPTPSYSTHSQYTMDVNFAGTSTGGRSSNVGAVFSSAAFTNSGVLLLMDG